MQVMYEYEVWPKGNPSLAVRIVAATQGKAKKKVHRSLSEAGYRFAYIELIARYLRKAYAIRPALPEERIALKLMRHTLGLDHHGIGEAYRNYFMTGPATIDWPHLQSLVAKGHMVVYPPIPGFRDHHQFTCTDSGRQWVADRIGHDTLSR